MTALDASGLERRLTARDHDALRLWLRLMSVHKLVAAEIRQRLQESAGMTLARFDLLSQLEREAGGLRMGDLSKRLMVTTGNITQITDQLEREGLVERRPDPHSRRARLVRLTAAGRRAFQTVASAHEAWIVELFSGLSIRERQSMLTLLGKAKLAMTGSRPAGHALRYSGRRKGGERHAGDA
ncbi:MAG TPA: MarR family transcriptional regulator [Stellaceae bacterium]|nr:MarR family transcriptional regulator [Stellaceae bacterium]